MKQSIAIFGLLIILLSSSSCKKENSSVEKNPIKEDFIKNINSYQGKYGFVNADSISIVQRNLGKLIVTIASVQKSLTIKEFILVSDDRELNNPIRTVYYMESNLQLSATQFEKDHFNGYMSLLNLTNGQLLKYDIKDGIKSISELSSRDVKSPDLRNNWGCVRGCVNTTMNSMSWGSYVICVAALPECAAGVFLGCEIDCTFR